MSKAQRILWLVCAALFAAAAIRLTAADTNDTRRKEIEAFNKNYVELHLKMQTHAIFDLWADDGVDLMPGEAPIIGKKAIVAWVEDLLAKMPGHIVLKQEMEFHDIYVAGEWASEWATEHQVVQPPDGKPLIEGFGKMALILHRESSGQWKIQQEMWNAAPKP